MPAVSRKIKSPTSPSTREVPPPKNDKPESEHQEISGKGEKQKNKGGRPAFGPSEVQRGLVKALAMVGCSRQAIAEVIDIDVATLIKAFETELREGSAHLLARAGSNIWNTLGSKDEKNALKASMFVLQTKGKDYGWSKTVDLELRRQLFLGMDFSRLDDNDTAELQRLLMKAGAPVELSDFPRTSEPQPAKKKP
jgi:hypothetical protein